MDGAPYFQTNNPASTSRRLSRESHLTRTAQSPPTSLARSLRSSLKGIPFQAPPMGIYDATPGFNGICHVNMLCISYGDYTICGMFFFGDTKKGASQWEISCFFSMELGVPHFQTAAGYSFGTHRRCVCVPCVVYRYPLVN